VGGGLQQAACHRRDGGGNGAGLQNEEERVRKLQFRRIISNGERSLFEAWVLSFGSDHHKSAFFRGPGFYSQVQQSFT
jgi:hypothetical protein